MDDRSQGTFFGVFVLCFDLKERCRESGNFQRMLAFVYLAAMLCLGATSPDLELNGGCVFRKKCSRILT